MLNLKLLDKVPCSEIRKRTKTIDLVMTKMEIGRTESKNEVQDGPNAAHSGNQGEGIDERDDQTEVGKTT